jgi:hypothetical protein
LLVSSGNLWWRFYLFLTIEHRSSCPAPFKFQVAKRLFLLLVKARLSECGHQFSQNLPNSRNRSHSPVRTRTHQILANTLMLSVFCVVMLLTKVFRGHAFRLQQRSVLQLPSPASFCLLSPSCPVIIPSMVPSRLHSSAFGGAVGDTPLPPDNSAAQKSSKPFGAPKGAADDSSSSSSVGGWGSLGLMDEVRGGE